MESKNASSKRICQNDAARIEQQTGIPIVELTEDELTAAMRYLKIQAIELDDNDRAIITDSAALTSAPQTLPTLVADATESLVDEIEWLAGLRDQGIINEDDLQVAKISCSLSSLNLQSRSW